MSLTIFRQEYAEVGAVTTLNRFHEEAPCNENKTRVAEIQRGILKLGEFPIIKTVSDISCAAPLLARCHNSSYLEFLKNQSNVIKGGHSVLSSEYTAPGVTPETFIVKGIYRVALAAFRTAAEAANHISRQDKGVAYALVRPPGHHAGPGWLGGYCYG